MGIQTDIDKEIKESAKIFLYFLTVNADADYDELIRRWKNSSSGSDVRKQLELKMDELNKTQLPKITNYDELTRRWENSSFGSDARKQLELRIKVLINKDKLSLNKAFRKVTNTPTFLKEVLTSMAKNIV